MTPPLRIVVPDDAPPALAGTPVEARLRALGDVTLYDSIASDPATLAERLQGAHVAVNIRSSSPFSADVVAACPELRYVAVLGVGVDNVDLAACGDRGVVVTNTPGHSTLAVAEHALGLALAVARALPQNDRAVREGSWARSPVVQLAGKTLGVVGAGPIGKRMAELGRSLGMEVLAWTFRPSTDRAEEFGAPFVPLEELLRSADVVSLHLPISERSRGLLGRRELSLMKPTALLVNTARGAIVDEEALAEALREGRLAGAGLDAYSEEPLPLGHPLAALDNVVLSPHNAAMTPEAGLRGLEMVAENIEAWLSGAPTHVVT